jgi:hypothetical protein
LKVVLDECVPEPLRNHLAPHEVFTVRFLGWRGTRNGALLRRAAEAGFDALITIDRGYADEQNLDALPVSVVLVEAGSDDFEVLVALAPKIVAVLDVVPLRRFSRVV